MILFVTDRKDQNITKSIINGCYELDEVEVELNNLNALTIKYNIAIYHSIIW